MDNDILTKARDWAAHDPDPATREALERSLESAQAGDEAAAAELEAAFAGPLEFGTAGLRGEIGYGESRMNRAVVIRTTAGLMAWLSEQVDKPRVVVGCDARHGSADFARAAAQVISAAGGEALELPQQLPTPLTAFAVKHFGADAGIMVTASHNPAKDNGYKVYLGGRVALGEADGVQIVPPADAQIAAKIAGAPPADVIAQSTGGIRAVDPSPEYVSETASLAEGAPNPADLRIVLTPMHGVGGGVALDVLAAAGFTDVHVVPEQANPDPDFPTVAFPNPEEQGALDLAIDLAKTVSADVVLALDPDADRCSLAIPWGNDGGWRQLSGDEIGALLGEWIASSTPTGTLANSIVSSRLLSKIAAKHGHPHATTLTGFKWIARTPNIVFGYEEAIGFCVNPRSVSDKDGISACTLAARIAAELKAAGSSIEERLDDIAREYGLYATSPLTFRVADLSLIGKGMENLRTNPPTELAGSPVVEFVDLRNGYEEVPGTDGILIRTEADDRVVVRPSGTEPKLKCYLEVVFAPAQEVPRAQADQRLAALNEDVAVACGMK